MPMYKLFCRSTGMECSAGKYFFHDTSHTKRKHKTFVYGQAFNCELYRHFQQTIIILFYVICFVFFHLSLRIYF